MRWCYFGTRDVGWALQWAEAGGVAVHENLFRLREMRCAHLLARDEDLLVAAALVVGCQAHWIQRTRRLHFDLVGESLVRALIHCGIDPARPPARSVWRPS